MLSPLSGLTPEQAPLRGVRVIEFGQYIAAPAAGQTLADLGADVIKVEPPTGDAARTLGWTHDEFGPMFSAYNRHKRSVVLDLRRPHDQQLALRLVAGADVVLQNARPGVMEKLGLDGRRLTERFPRLVYGQVSGFGQTGEHSQRAGLDIAAQAESGMMSLNGDADRNPVRVGFTVVDVMASQMLVNGVLAALIGRGVSGKGALVDMSLVDVAVAALSNAWTDYALTGQRPIRRGNGQAMLAPAADVVPTKDGLVVISAYIDAHFGKLCELIGRPELAVDARFAANRDRVTNREALLQAMCAGLSHLTSDEVAARLSKAGLVVGVIRTLDQVHAGQSGVADDLFIAVHAPGRLPVDVPGLPVRLNDAPRPPAHLPALGQHTQEVLNALEPTQP